MKIINDHINQIISLCRKYHVVKLWVFGSILTDRFNPQSDIDLLVDFDRSKIELLDRADVFFDFIQDMEDLLGHKIDLTEYCAIKNHYFKQEVDNTCRLLWTA